jgi:tape measure domain-containing protein
MSGIVIDVAAKTAKAEQDLAQINNALRNIESTTNRATKSFAGMIKSLGAIAVSGISVSALKNISSEFTVLNNKIANVTGRTNELIVVQQKLFDISERTRGSISGTVGLFGAFGRSLRSAGVSTNRLLEATELVQKAITISGSSAESANAAIIQLGQGLSSGVLRGEELNSVLEQTPRIGVAIADSLGVTLGQLRLIAAEGKLTSDVVFKGILSQSEKINKEFGVLAPSLNQATSLLSDSIKIYISELDNGLNLSNRIGAALFQMSKTIRQASDNAFQLGVRISATFNQVRAGLTLAFRPIILIITNLGKQLLEIVPKAFLTRTFRSEVRESIRLFDDLTGGWIRAFRKFRFADLFRFESDVEKAIRQLKRLSPEFWAAPGEFDILSIKRFFSKDTLVEYSKAFEDLGKAVAVNSRSFGASIRRFFIDVDFAIKNVIRYFGITTDTLVTFKKGTIIPFIQTLTQLIRGITDTSLKVYQLGRIIVTTLEPSFKTLLLSILDAIKTIPEIFAQIGEVFKFIVKLIKTAYQAIKDFIVPVDLFYPFKVAKRSVEDFYYAITNTGPIERALIGLKRFGRDVINVFASIFREVIGNSWWTDTVEGVVSSATALWPRVQKSLENFRNQTIDIFKSISNKKINIDISNIKFKTNDFALPFLSKQTVGEDFLAVMEQIKESFTTVAETFPSVIKLAFAGISAIFVAALIDEPIIRYALLAVILASITTSSALLAEKFGQALTGQSFVSIVSYKLGQLAGTLFAAFIREIPDIINALLGAVSAFIRGFVEQLPIIGQALKSVFAVGDRLGVAGPLGLIATYFFGKSFSAFKGLFASADDVVGKTGGLFSNLVSILSGKDDGFLSRFFFGPLGFTRSIALVGIVANSLGAFQALFSGSALAQIIAQGGLIYLLITGRRGISTITDVIGQRLVAPMSDAIATILRKLPAGSSLYNVFFGDVGTWQERASAAITGVVTAISAKVIEVASPVISGGYSFIKTVLLGTNPTKTITDIKKLFASLIIALSLQLETLKATLSSTSVFQSIKGYLSELFKGKAAAVATGNAALLTTVATQTRAKSAELGSIAARVGGESGIIGRLLFGRVGRFVLVGGLLALFSSVASASTNFAKTSETAGGIFENVWNNLKLENPIAALAIQIVGVSLPFIIGALIIFRAQVIGLLMDAFSPQRIIPLVNGIGRAIRSGLVKQGAILGAGAAGGGFLAETLGISAVEGALLGLTFAGLFMKSLAKVFTLANFGKLILGTFSLLFSKIVLIATTVGGVLGALYIFLFGKKGEFFQEIERAFNKVKEIFGFKVDPKNAQRISNDLLRFARSQVLDVGFTTENIDFTRLSSGDRKGLDSSIEELTSALIEAKTEYEKTGRIEGGTRARISDLNRGLDNYTKRLELRTNQLTAENLSESLQRELTVGPQTRFEEFTLFSKQLGLDLLKFGVVVGQNIRIALEPRQGRQQLLRLELEEIKKSPAFIANLRVLSQQEENLKELAENFKDLDIPADVAKDIKDTVQQFATINRQIRVESGRLFPTKDLKELQDSQKNIVESLLQKFTFARELDEARRAAEAFRKDITELEADFKRIGVTLDTTFALFAKTDVDFLDIKGLANDAKRLEEELKKARNVAERNKVVIEIEVIRTLVERKAREARQLVFSEQANLAENLQSVGIADVINPRVAGLLADETAEKLNRLATVYNRLEEASKFRTPEARKQLAERIPFADAKATNAIVQGGQTLISYLNNLSDVISTTLVGSIEQVPNALNTLTRQIAQSSGFEIPINLNLIRTKDQIKELEQLILKFFVENKRLLADPNNTALQRIVSNVRKEIQALIAPSRTFSDIMSSISGVGVNVNLADVVTLGRDDILRLKQATEEIDRQNKLINEAEVDSIDFSADAIVEAFKKREQAYKVVEKTYLDTLLNTPSKILNALQSVGIGSTARARFVNPKDIQDLAAITKEIESIKIDLGKTSNAANFENLIKDLLDAETRLERLKNRLEDFESFLSKINTTLKLEIEPQVLLRFPQRLLGEIKRTTEDLDAKLKEEFAKPFEQRDEDRILQLLKERDQVRRSIEREAIRTGAAAGARVSQIEDLGPQRLIETVQESLPSISEEFLKVLPIEALNSLANDAVAIKNNIEKSAEGFSDTSAVIARNIDLAFDAFDKLPNKAQQATAALEFVGVSIDNASANLISDANAGRIRALTESIAKIQGQIQFAETDVDRQALQNLSNYLQDQLQRLVERATIDVYQRARDAGVEFANTVSSAITTGISDVLKGKSSVKDFLRSLVDNFTSAVIDSFVKGLTDPLLGEGGAVRNFFKDIGASIFSPSNIAATAGSEGSDAETGIVSQLLTGIGGFFTTIFGLLTGQQAAEATNSAAEQVALNAQTTAIIAAIVTQTGALTAAILSSQITSSVASNAISGLSLNTIGASIFPFAATGGRIIGPGTGTSDSIPAMLSNGEFVINARQTSKFLPLLEAINSGDIKRFASGGLVSQLPIEASNVMSTRKADESRESSQIVNINITGDISRQTRTEIFKLIPSISQGINSYNREKGLR